MNIFVFIGFIVRLSIDTLIEMWNKLNGVGEVHGLNLIVNVVSFPADGVGTITNVHHFD